MTEGANEKTHVAVLDHRVTQVESVIKSIDESLRTLVRLEEKHTQTAEALKRAFTEIKDNDARIGVVEQEMPTLKLVRGWVITGTIALVGLVLLTLIKMGFGWGK